MADSISWALNVTVSGGPKLSKTQVLDIDAYDKIEVVIPPEAKDMEVQIQPALKDLIQFLVISFDPLAKTEVKLSYSIDQPEPDATKRIKLGYMQMLVGLGAVNALGADKSLNKLYFYRDKDDLKPADQVSLQILVGRKVAPDAAQAAGTGGAGASGSPAGSSGTGSTPATGGTSGAGKTGSAGGTGSTGGTGGTG